MAVRLNKIVKEVRPGVSVSMLAEFLTKKGIPTDNDPNAKVSDESLAMLWKEFGEGEMPVRGEKPAEKPIEKPAEVIAQTTPAENEPAEQPQEKEPVVQPKVEPAIHVKPIGKIDLEQVGKPSKEVAKPVEPVEEKKVAPVKEKAVETPKAEPVATEVEKKVEKEPQPVQPSEHAKEEKAAEAEADTDSEPQEEQKSGDIYSLTGQKLSPSIKVISTINLDAINQYTRPKKKTNQERQKERDERRAKEAADRKPHAGTPGQQANGNPSRTGAPGQPAQGANGQGADANGKKKRNRIRDGKVRVDSSDYTSSPSFSNDRRGDRNKHGKTPFTKPEVSDEDVSKQIKDTLARLSQKPKKGTKYRKEKREAVSQRQHQLEAREAAESNIIKLTEFVTVNDLANMMNLPVVQIISKCMEMGQMVSINQRLDAETINIVAEEFGFQTEYVSAEVLQAIHEEEDNAEDLVPRAPIITVMGHVDHGKTSLLDYIRKSNVIAGEAGGITQHIGAYNVTLEDGRHITFLDTPGHEAFTAMRARGAQVTDIAIIIVAADDNVMPQTVEAINHASIAGVPIVFAINKVDKPAADPEKIKKELAEMNYLVEDWGGKYQSQDISAKQGMGVKELLEKVLLEAEMLDLKANPNRRATGNIIESSLDKGRGYIATVLVQNGTLKVGDIMVAGTCHGRIKAMFNERNQKIKQAAPGEPALILGLNGAPQAGDNFNVLETEQEAREVANKREQLQREQGLRTGKILTLAEIGRRIAIGNFKEINLIVKGDVDGSVEALSDSLIKLSTEQIQVNVIHKAVGQISESDVTLASASNAIIIGFQVRPSADARRLAEREGVDIRLYSIIYDAIEELKSAMEGMLAPVLKEETIGAAEVRETFHISKVGMVAGCMVKEGKIKRGCKVRVIRDGIVIHTGELDSLKRFKDDAKEVTAGLECGISLKSYNDVQIGDMIESFEEHEVKQTL